MKKKVLELTEIIKKYGYWSNEVLEYNKTLDYELMVKVNNEARELSKNVL